MKKFSDIFSSYKSTSGLAARRIATTALFMVAVITMSVAQDLIVTEGSVRSFSIQPQAGTTHVWDLRDAGFNAIDPLAFTFIEGQFEPSVTLRFNDMNRVNGEMLLLVVTESFISSGCGTSRALRILVEPNNMYLEFAVNTSQDCFNMGDYMAPLMVGLNFNFKQPSAQFQAIPENLFPLKLSYTVRNITEGSAAVAGNSGNPVELAFSSINDYFLPVTEAVGLPDQTTEYELVISSVRDKYDTEITTNSGDIRIQIRVINHLPQSGTMDMALAYVINTVME
jgi:hypothetical protein